VQLAQISQIVQIVDSVYEVVTQHQTPQLLVLLQRKHFLYALVCQLDFVDSPAVLLASRLYNRFLIHF
jgi:hypothetical protein